MANEKKYQGWANYETWAVKLWIDNEEGSYRYWNEEARDTAQGEIDTDPADWKDTATSNLADKLKNEHEDNAPELGGPYGDLLTAALSEVDWYEIAGAMIEDVSDSLEMTGEIDVESNA
jgi:hypothetical protein